MTELSKEQSYVVNEVLSQIKKRKLFTIGGFAGVGKTVVANSLKNKLNRFKACAYTGKAASVLRDKGIYDASTIHSLIYEPRVDHADNVEFVLKDSLDCDGIIIDEASMLNKEIFRDLESFDLPLICIGDHGQLPPVSGGDFNLMENPEYKLETVHRNAGDIAHFANHIRQGLDPHDFKKSSKIKFVYDINDKVLTSVDQVICAYNATRVKINKQIRSKLDYAKNVINVGEKIMCLRNNKRTGIFNGMQGYVRSCFFEKGRTFIDFDANGFFPRLEIDLMSFNSEKPNFKYDPDSPHPFEYAYCITAHKCVHPDTLVETNEGILPIKKINSTGTIATEKGMKSYKNFIHNSPMPSVSITTRDGYSIIVTENHKVEFWDGQKFSMQEAKYLKKSDIVRLKLGSNFDYPNSSVPECPVNGDVREKLFNIPKEMSEELAEFLGLMVADGTVYKTGFRLVKRHEDVNDRFYQLVKNLFGYEAHKIKVYNTNGYEISSTFLRRWLSSIDGLQPNNKFVPNCIINASKKIQCAFLRGVFEDGWVNIKSNPYIGFHSAYPELIKQIKYLLLRNNIASGTLKDRVDKIYIYGENANVFKEKIGFISSFKQNRLVVDDKTNSRDRIPISLENIVKFKDYLSLTEYQNARHNRYLSRKIAKRIPFLQEFLEYHYTSVSSIIKIMSESMCVEVPDGHRFLQNGFNWGNSQGSQWGSVCVIEQKCDKWDHVRWFYTAVSRAESKLFIVPADKKKVKIDKDDPEIKSMFGL